MKKDIVWFSTMLINLDNIVKMCMIGDIKQYLFFWKDCTRKLNQKTLLKDASGKLRLYNIICIINYIYVIYILIIFNLFDFRFTSFIFSGIVETGQYYKTMNKIEISYKSNSLHNHIKNSEPKTVSKTLNNDLKEINKILIYPFKLLKVVKSNSSVGKCWIFHLDNCGHLSGFLFPSGYRVYNSKSMLLVGGRFFLENRNFYSTKRGFMAAKIPMKPQIGYNKCKFVINILFARTKTVMKFF